MVSALEELAAVDPEAAAIIEAVTRGAKLLDGHYENWWLGVDVDLLDCRWQTRCLAQQVSGSGEVTMGSLSWVLVEVPPGTDPRYADEWVPPLADVMEAGKAHGFCFHVHHDAWLHTTEDPRLT